MNKAKKFLPILLSFTMLSACTASENPSDTTTSATSEIVTTTEAATEEVLPEGTVYAEFTDGMD